MENEKTYSTFAGNRRIVSGGLRTMLLQTKEYLDQGGTSTIIIFEDQTGNQIDFDFRGTPDEVLEKLASHPLFAETRPHPALRKGPGRPKLGVVSREVTLLPRHWDWLEQQGGISATLRKLVEEAKKRGQSKRLANNARDAASKFMWGMAGNLPHFEEASRALFSKDYERLRDLINDWPEDIRNHTERLVEEAMYFEKLDSENTQTPSNR